jgi:hypothetical protein
MLGKQTKKKVRRTSTPDTDADVSTEVKQF